MKKRIFAGFAWAVLLASIAFLSYGVFSKQPVDYADWVEIAEIETCTEEALRNKMLGPCRADMHEGWSESGRAESEIDPGIYKFEDISRKMI